MSGPQQPSPAVASRLRPHLSADAQRLQLQEERQHISDSQVELQDAVRTDQQRSQEYRALYGAKTSTSARVADTNTTAIETRDDGPHQVIFHMDDKDIEMTTQLRSIPIPIPIPVATNESRLASLQSRRSSAGHPRLKRRPSSAVDVSHVSDPDLRRFLDPRQKPVSHKELESWSDDKLLALLNAVRSEHFPRILEQAEADGLQARAQPLTFSRVTYTDGFGQTRLQDVSGYLVPGEVVGIIAAPDAGASTLLDLLADATNMNKLPGRIDGQVLYNQLPPDHTFKQSVGYISQADMHNALLSVEETLFFSARLRLPPSISDKLIRFRVQTVMALLGLTGVQHSFVGDDFVKGISGGQKRRLSVGVELVAGHSVLLGDLVTNGLDSATAFDVIRTFRHMVRAGLTIACTVVQAGPELFQLFHRVIVMSKGSIIFSGPPSLAEPYFRSLGFPRPSEKTIPQFLEELSAEPEAFYRPRLPRSLLPSKESSEDLGAQFQADSKWLPAAEKKQFFKEQQYSLNISEPGAPASNGTAGVTSMPLNAARVDAWRLLNSSYQKTIFYADVRETLADLAAEGPATEDSQEGDKTNGAKVTNPQQQTFKEESRFFATYAAPLSLQLRETFIRQARLFYRARSTWLYVWTQALIMGFMLGSIFYTDELDESNVGVRSRQGLFFYLIAYMSFNSFGLLPIFLMQRPLFYAQSADRYFSPVAYFTSLMSVQLVVLIGELFLLLVPVWGLSGLAGFPLSGAFWFAFLVLLTAALAARFFILLCSHALAGDIAATTTLTVCFYIFALLSGEFIPKKLSPPGWSWAYNLSYCYWLLEALVLNNYVDAKITYDLSGWLVGDDSKWTAWEHGLYFVIGFAVAALVVMCYVSWARKAVPAAADFVSPTSAAYIAETEADGEGDALQVEANGEKSVESAAAKAAAEIAEATASKSRVAFLEFKDLNYWVTLPTGEEKQLLKGVFGFARPGRLVALIGKSGAGKTTLLDVLAGKKSSGRLSGSILVNGKPKVQSQFTGYAGYVEQFDSFAPLNTVRETVRMSGRLRLSPDLTDAEVDAKVDRVLDMLNIRPVEHAIVGFPGMGGISMELRKKLSIAVEVIAEPALLFLDEPTTGLDSHSASNVMKTVRALASSITVICTIHQPPSSLVAYFQDVLLVEDGGKVVYFGDIEQLPPFLHSAGLPAITPGRNVSDYALEVISERTALETDAKKDVEEGRGGALKPLSEIFLASPFSNPVKASLEKGLLNAKQIEQVSSLLTAPRKRASTLLQIRELTERFWQTSVRHRDSLFVRYFFAVVFGFMVGSVFWRVGHTQSEGTKHLAVVFFTVGHFLFSSSSFFPPIFMNRVLYFREHSTNMYSAFSYFIARFLGDLPHIIAEVFITTILVYFISGLSDDNHSARYGYFFWANVIFRITAIFMTQLVASVIAAPDFAFSVLATTMYLMFALTGFFIPQGDIPKWWRWLADLNFLKYGLQFLALTEYKDEFFTCDPIGNADSMVVMTQSELAAYDICGHSEPILTFPGPTSGTVLRCGYPCGYALLDDFGVDTSVSWQIDSFVILHCFGVFFALCGFLALKYINHIRR